MFGGLETAKKMSFEPWKYILMYHIVHADCLTDAKDSGSNITLDGREMIIWSSDGPAHFHIITFHFHQPWTLQWFHCAEYKRLVEILVNNCVPEMKI